MSPGPVCHLLEVCRVVSLFVGEGLERVETGEERPIAGTLPGWCTGGFKHLPGAALRLHECGTGAVGEGSDSSPGDVPAVHGPVQRLWLLSCWSVDVAVTDTGGGAGGSDLG